MDRYSQAGDKVSYLGKNGYEIDRKAIEHQGVKVGDTLTIEYTIVTSWRTQAKFVGIDGEFNAEMFGEPK